MNIKRTVRFFTICDYEEEQAYLREMHRSGWKFLRLSGLCVYHFEACAPEDVVYQLDFNQDGLAHRDEYLTMFRDCGWEYLQDYLGYSYFRKPASRTSGEESIFCDNESRMDMLGRVFRGKVLPLAAIFSCVLLPQLASSISRGEGALIGFLSLLTGLYLGIFLRFAWKYRKLKRRS